jgi:hypothetical protein
VVHLRNSNYFCGQWTLSVLRLVMMDVILKTRGDFYGEWNRRSAFSASGACGHHRVRASRDEDEKSPAGARRRCAGSAGGRKNEDCAAPAVVAGRATRATFTAETSGDNSPADPHCDYSANAKSEEQ